MNCGNLVSADPEQILDKQLMMDLTSKIQGREDAITELLHERIKSNPKDFPF